MFGQAIFSEISSFAGSPACSKITVIQSKCLDKDFDAVFRNVVHVGSRLEEQTSSQVVARKPKALLASNCQSKCRTWHLSSLSDEPKLYDDFSNIEVEEEWSDLKSVGGQQHAKLARLLSSESGDGSTSTARVNNEGAQTLCGGTSDDTVILYTV